MNYFMAYEDAINWVRDNHADITELGGNFIKSRMIIHFPNGNDLVIGYGEDNKYLASEFMFIIGPASELLRTRVRI